MTRANARELAVHLIYGRDFTGEEPDQVVSVRLAKEYYAKLSVENDIYTERPTKPQIAYLDNVVSGVANRCDELNEQIQKYSMMMLFCILLIYVVVLSVEVISSLGSFF